eukprot:5822876-Alexandrium_andersonii.AAC.1
MWGPQASTPLRRALNGRWAPSAGCYLKGRGHHGAPRAHHLPAGSRSAREPEVSNVSRGTRGVAECASAAG